ncbi:protein takeout-like isoform X2 [Anoplophora glabripennis]|uniref:protein takeout-like isoform X2 n=1 Tax=Anoplophora glabripennis TaxID=217634 RepID=UPI000873A45D|nr:protein takeout-like isoform X2 [Anoplophora glabripennis]
MYLFLFVVAAASCLTDAKHLPAYIKPCKKADPNFRQCVIKSASETLPHIMKGDKEFKSPVLVPFKISEITISPSEQLTIKLKDVTLRGLENAVVEDMNFDLEKKHVSAKLSFKWISIEGEYEIDGRILVLPIKGHGPANISSDNLVVDFSFDYKLVTKQDGKEYFNTDINPIVSYTITDNHFYFGNLFNGDKTLEEGTNKFLNEHWMEVYKDFQGAISETIKSVSADIIKTFISTVPYDEVFP